jgi:hypothetical protein
LTGIEAIKDRCNDSEKTKYFSKSFGEKIKIIPIGIRPLLVLCSGSDSQKTELARRAPNSSAQRRGPILTFFTVLILDSVTALTVIRLGQIETML